MSTRVTVEYRLKRASYPILARPDRSRRVFHVCQWKTASQWVQSVLSDPRAYRRHRLLPYARAELASIKSDSLSVQPLRRDQQGLFLSTFATHDQVREIAGDTFTAVVVVRHPIDLLVSWYVSSRYTHPPNPLLDKSREKMQRLDDMEGLRYMAERFSAQSQIPRSWLKAKPQPVFVRYEDLVVRREPQAWNALAAVLSTAADGDTYRSVGSLYDLIISLRRTRMLFGGSKYSPTIKIDRQDSRFAEIVNDIARDYRDLFEAFHYSLPHIC